MEEAQMTIEDVIAEQEALLRLSKQDDPKLDPEDVA